MRIKDRRVNTSGVDDLRGSPGGRRTGAGMAIGGGAGLIGVIVVILFAVLGGGNLPPGAFDVTQLGGGVLGDQPGTVAESDLAERCATENAIEQYDDCYMVKIYNETDEVWADEFATGEFGNVEYHAPRMAFFTDYVSTGCGGASAEVGPFYCPPDERIYFDLGFLDELQQQFGAEGRYAQAYILAHEFGHHLQSLLGIERQVRVMQQRDPASANELSVRLELQADCLAGVWGALANDAGNVAITEAELQQAQDAAAAVGDDRIQRKTQGRVDPEAWTHGSAEQRREWYLTGYNSADPASCDTFDVRQL
jgi:predicted metalloprotease